MDSFLALLSNYEVMNLVLAQIIVLTVFVRLSRF